MTVQDILRGDPRWEPTAATRSAPDGAAGMPAEPVPPPVPTGAVRPTRLPRRLRGRSAVAAARSGLVPDGDGGTA